MLGKFGPGPIGTWSGLDQTQWSQSQSGIFPKKQDRLVSGLGNPTLPKTIQTQSGPGLHNLYKQFANTYVMDYFLFIYLIQKITNNVEGMCQDVPLVNGLVGRV